MLSADWLSRRFFQFTEIIFVDHQTGAKVYFKRQLANYPITAAVNYGNAAATGLWHGVGANNAYSYQLLICDDSFYSGFFISGYTSNCYKTCNNWCGDKTSPYFRTASTSSSYKGVAFNTNGHSPNIPSSRLISVGLRWVQPIDVCSSLHEQLGFYVALVSTWRLKIVIRVPTIIASCSRMIRHGKIKYNFELIPSVPQFASFLRWTSNAQKNKTWWATLKNIHSVQRLDNKTVCVKWRTEPILKILGPLNQSIAVSGTFDTWQIEHSSWVYWPQAKIHPLRKAGKAKLQFFSLSH